MPTSLKSLAIAWAVSLLVVIGGISLLEATYTAPVDDGSDAAAEPVDTGPTEPPFRPIPVQADPELLEITDQGPLPVIGADGTRSSDYYAATPVQAAGAYKIALIVADMGKLSRNTRRALADLPEHTTFAFSPFGQGINGWAEQARRANHEVLLMLPMEPNNYPQDDPGPLTLLAAQTPSQNLNLMRASLARLTGYVGVLGHKGSRFTEARESMRPMLQELRARGLMYVDGQSTPLSNGPEMARTMGVPSALNSRVGFIDDELSAAIITERLDELERRAAQDGFAVGIARPYPVSIDAIQIWAGGLESRGAVLVPISQVADRQPLQQQ